MPPETVIRFYGNVDFAKDVIENRQIAFVHIEKMNDPFDPYMYLHTEFYENRNNFIKWLRAAHPQQETWFEKNVPPDQFQGGFRAIRANFERHRKTTYMLSFCSDGSETPARNNLYMWGHYGNGHRGIALEFDRMELSKCIVQQSGAVDGNGLCLDDVWSEVIYSDSVDPLSCQSYFDFLRQSEAVEKGQLDENVELPIEHYFQRLLCTKHLVWKNECEWRLMWTNDSGAPVYKCPISANSLRSVIFGLRVEESIVQAVTYALRGNFVPAPLALRAVKRPDDFALTFEPIGPS